MATRAPPTVAASKQAFLLTQIRQLSRPLAPSRQWREEVAAASDATRQRKRKRRHDDEPEDNDHGAADKPPTARAVDDALAAVNAALAADHRRAHAPQATRHVAEQIERLYFWDGESRTGESGGGEAEESLLVGMDFCRPKSSRS